LLNRRVAPASCDAVGVAFFFAHRRKEMHMRANPFESQLERLARTLTEQFGVQVVCQGDNAWTDGRQIVLPSPSEPLNEDLERLAIGYLDHEMGHVAFSDFGVAEQFAKSHPGYEGLLNVVEDALIERRAMDRWPGVRRNLDMMFRQIRGRVAQLIAQRGPFDRFCTAVYLRLSHHGDLMGLEAELAGYEDLLDHFTAVQTTHDAGILAEALLDRWLSRNSRKNRGLDGNGGENDASQGGSSSGASPNGGHGSNTGSAPKQGSAEADDADDAPDGDARSDGPNCDQEPDTQANAPEPSGNDSSPGSGKSKGWRQSKDRSATTAGDSDNDPASHTPSSRSAPHSGGTLIGEALSEAISESVARMTNSSEYRVFTKQHDRIGTVAQANDAEVQLLLASGGDVVRRLRRGLANALRSAEKRWWRDDQVRGSLSPRTLYRLATDRAGLDVFRVRCEVQGRSTAVSIVLDASGSMTSAKMGVARQAVRVLLEALADLKIATEAFTFTTGDRFTLGAACQQTGQDHVQLQGRFSRFGNLEIGLIKRFGEPVKAALRRLPGVRGSGLTPLGEAMQTLDTRPTHGVAAGGRWLCRCRVSRADRGRQADRPAGEPPDHAGTDRRQGWLRGLRRGGHEPCPACGRPYRPGGHRAGRRGHSR
jgi:cobaltochelatase CobT